MITAWTGSLLRPNNSGFAQVVSILLLEGVLKMLRLVISGADKLFTRPLGGNGCGSGFLTSIARLVVGRRTSV